MALATEGLDPADAIYLNSASLPALPIDYIVHPQLSALRPFPHVRSATAPHRWQSQDLQQRHASPPAFLRPAQCAARWWQTRALQGKKAFSSRNSPPLLRALL